MAWSATRAQQPGTIASADGFPWSAHHYARLLRRLYRLLGTASTAE